MDNENFKGSVARGTFVVMTAFLLLPAMCWALFSGALVMVTVGLPLWIISPKWSQIVWYCVLRPVDWCEEQMMKLECYD